MDSSGESTENLHVAGKQAGVVPNLKCVQIYSDTSIIIILNRSKTSLILLSI